MVSIRRGPSKAVFAAAVPAFLVAASLFLCGSAAALEAPLADWNNRFHIGGTGAFRFQAGQKNAQLDRNDSFSVYQAGVTFDVDIVPNWSVWYDLTMVREAQSASSFNQQLYVRWDNIVGSYLNAKIGRTFTPFGEDYLHWDAISNPLASWTVAFPWALDEGVLFFGDILPDDKLSYAGSVQNGGNSFTTGVNYPDAVNKAGAIKLFSKPVSWLYLSSSLFNTGKRGNFTVPGHAEMWLSGFHIQPLGATTAPSGASPSNFVDAQMYEEDIRAVSDLGNLWMNLGYVHVLDGGGHNFDRYIRYYTGQALGYLPRTQKKAYLVARYSYIGTMSATEGYRFAGTQIAFNSGSPPFTSPYAAYNYNQRELYRWSFGGGYWINQNILAKAEYSIEGTHLIQSALTPNNTSNLGYRNFFVGELAVRF